MKIRDIPPAARGDAILPRPVFLAAHRHRETLRLDNKSQSVKPDNKIELPAIKVDISQDDRRAVITGQRLDDALKRCAFRAMLNKRADIDFDAHAASSATASLAIQNAFAIASIRVT